MDGVPSRNPVSPVSASRLVTELFGKQFFYEPLDLAIVAVAGSVVSPVGTTRFPMILSTRMDVADQAFLVEQERNRRPTPRAVRQPPAIESFPCWVNRRGKRKAEAIKSLPDARPRRGATRFRVEDADDPQAAISIDSLPIVEGWG